MSEDMRFETLEDGGEDSTVWDDIRFSLFFFFFATLGWILAIALFVWDVCRRLKQSKTPP